MTKNDNTKILIATSTLPFTDSDPVPAFVKDQAIAIKSLYPDTSIVLLAPYNPSIEFSSKKNNPSYTEYRFHYFWPFRFELLAGRGIMPALKKNKILYFQVPFLVMFEFFALLKYTRKEKPDMIYAHWFTPQAITANLVSILTKTPFVYTSHSADVDIWKKIPLGKFLVRSINKRANAITAVSNRSLDKIKQFYNPESWDAIKHKFARIPMGINYGSLSPNSKAIKNTINNSTTNLLFIGRLTEKKGVQYLLPAFSKLLKSGHNLHLIIAGDGEYRSVLENLSIDLSITESVEFVGYVSGQAKQDYLSNAGIIVTPSIITESGDAEGLPVALMEALASGKLTISTKVSGADDIVVDGVHGLLINDRDIDAIVKAVEKLLKLSPQDRRKMQKKAQECAMNLDWSIIAERHYKFFMKMIKDGHGI